MSRNLTLILSKKQAAEQEAILSARDTERATGFARELPFACALKRIVKLIAEENDARNALILWVDFPSIARTVSENLLVETILTSGTANLIASYIRCSARDPKNRAVPDLVRCGRIIASEDQNELLGLINCYDSIFTSEIIEQINVGVTL